jgi:hypothetical protein
MEVVLWAAYDLNSLLVRIDLDCCFALFFFLYLIILVSRFDGMLPLFISLSGVLSEPRRTPVIE